MAKKKNKTEDKNKHTNNLNVVGLRAEVIEQPITKTLESNYMPYAMSVIVSRAIPEIDGFKPSHRKILYTMYKMGLLSGKKTKSANIVGQTMQLNPHGDASIYETMVRLSTGHEALLTPFIESKGNFGKIYSKDMSYAASRYTEAKLSSICAEVFKDIDKDTVDFVDSYDGTQKEPVLLPTSFPNILVSNNSGIAVGMASMICGFNLNEVCNTAIAYLRNPEHDILSTLPAPDFSTGGEIIYDRAEMEEIYASGKGGVKIRAKWRFLPKENIIEVFEIPYTATTNMIIDKVSDLIKQGKVKEIADMRDETDLNGLRLAIDLKRGTDPEKLMQKLFRLTPLQDSYPCNFNVLIAAYPKLMGVKEILDEWIAWRIDCIRRMLYHQLTIKNERLHLLRGLEKILLDIDLAIRIIRNTELEADVVPNLMIGFGIDNIQAEYVAEIKLRNINREYILKRTDEIRKLLKDIADIESTLNSKRKVKTMIIEDLTAINKKYLSPRRSTLVYSDELEEYTEEDDIPDYPVTLFLSKDGYLKKITPQSLKMSSEHKYKEDDKPFICYESSNGQEILFLTDRQQLYKTRVCDFEESKASSLGIFIPRRLNMDEGETIIAMFDPGDYKASILLIFENGKAARFQLASYETKTNRRKLINAYSDKSPVSAVFIINEEEDIVCYSDNKAMVFNSILLSVKSSRTTQGVNLMTLRKGKTLLGAQRLTESNLQNVQRYRAKNIPAAGAVLRQEDRGKEQLSFIDG